MQEDTTTKFIGDIVFNNGDKDISASDLVTKEEVNDVLKECVKKDDLSGYVQSSTLTEYAKKTDIPTVDLSGYVQTTSIVDVPTLNVKIQIIPGSYSDRYTLDINYDNPPKIIYIDSPPERKETYILEYNTYEVGYKSTDYDTTAHTLRISRNSAYIHEGFYGDAIEPDYNIDTSYVIYDISNDNDDEPKEIPTVEYVKSIVNESTPNIDLSGYVQHETLNDYATTQCTNNNFPTYTHIQKNYFKSTDLNTI